MKGTTARIIGALATATLAACRGDDVTGTASSLALPVSVVSQTSGQTIYALTTSNRLLRFESGDACSVTSERKITGLAEGESLVGIDFRPATGQLYGLGSTSRIYTIDVGSGAATAVGSGFGTPLEGTSFGFDFNPVVDRIRLVSNTGQNLRLNPITGGLAATDGTLAFAAGDANQGATPSVAGAAYTNPDNDPTTGTTLYDIDSAMDILVTQNPPNSGTLNTVGPLGVSTNELVGFDISASGVAYAALKATGKGTGGKSCGNSDLYTIDLSTGAATRIGTIGSNSPIIGIAIPTP